MKKSIGLTILTVVTTVIGVAGSIASGVLSKKTTDAFIEESEHKEIDNDSSEEKNEDD